MTPPRLDLQPDYPSNGRGKSVEASRATLACERKTRPPREVRQVACQFDRRRGGERLQRIAALGFTSSAKRSGKFLSRLPCAVFRHRAATSQQSGSDFPVKSLQAAKVFFKAANGKKNRASRRGAARCCRLSPPQTGLADFPHPASPKTFSDKRAQEVMDGR